MLKHENPERLVKQGMQLALGGMIFCLFGWLSQTSALLMLGTLLAGGGVAASLFAVIKHFSARR